MDIDEITITILYHVDLDSLQSLCESNKNINQLCHSTYFLNQRFNQLPINIDKHVDHTLYNLFYINHLIPIAHRLIEYLIKNTIYSFGCFSNDKRVVNIIGYSNNCKAFCIRYEVCCDEPYKTITLTKDKMPEYLVNLFLNHKQYVLYQVQNRIIINNVKKLEQYI